MGRIDSPLSRPPALDVRPVWREWPLILAYHSVSDDRPDSLAVRPADFERQIAWLHRRRYRSMTLAQLVDGTAEKGDRVVAITFDDGYADNYTAAFPILKRYGFVATVFLVSDFVDTDMTLEADAAEVARSGDPDPYRLLSWDQAGEMRDYGIEFGSHSCSHASLTALSSERRWEEVARSRTDIGARLGGEVRAFCYPKGDLDEETLGLVARAGYGCAVVTPPRHGIRLSRYALRRIGIYRHNTHLVFRLKTTSAVRRNYERLKWRPRGWARLSAARP